MVIQYKVDVGDKVKIGDIVVLFEAMKMENALASPVNGTVKSINFKKGGSVNKNQILAVIG
jgi:oxaloacetate decarboxylase alpha subunit/pyruvate carboxylase subunit B